MQFKITFKKMKRILDIIIRKMKNKLNNDKIYKYIKKEEIITLVSNGRKTSPLLPFHLGKAKKKKYGGLKAW